MSKASIARHEKFRAEVSAALIAVGAEIIRNNEYSLDFRLHTPRIGLLIFSMSKRDYNHRPKDERYSLYARLLFETKALPMAQKVNDVFGHAPVESMNRFSGKWNIHCESVEDVLNLLDQRLAWLMSND